LQQVREAALAHNSWRSVRIDIIIDPN
jgi:hypothetical protein